MKKLLLLAFLLTSTSILAAVPSKAKDAEHKNCLSTREYITTLRYLRAHTEFGLPDKEAIKLADFVSKGCSGAAKKFIHVTQTLVKARLTTADAISTAKKFVHTDDTKFETFVAIFKRSYLRDYLDLDLQTSLKFAMALSEEFDGSGRQARDDFSQLIEFCLDSDQLALPNPRCAKFAVKTTRLGQKYKKRIADEFIVLFEFITSTSGPNRTTIEALQISEKIIAMGPLASKNFIQAYHYGIAKSGRAMTINSALKFAEKMAKRSTQLKNS